MSESASTTEARVGFRTEVQLQVSATLDMLPIVRSVAGNLAMRADFDLDAVADFKLAVDEACSTLLLRATTGTKLSCDFALYRDEVRFAARVDSPVADQPDKESFSWHVLTTLTDNVRLWVDQEAAEATDSHHIVHIELSKQRTPGQA